MKDEKILYSFTWEVGLPTMELVEEKLNIPQNAIDQDFGIVEIDDLEKLYCILVSKDSIPTDEKDKRGQEFSNPRIAPFNLEEE